MGGITIVRNTVGSRRLGITLYLMIIAGTGALLFVIQFVQNVVLSMIILMGAMAVAAASLIYRGRYTFDEEGIHEELRPYARRFSLLRSGKRFFPWSAVKSYKLDHDLNRAYGEKWFLRIHFHGTRYTMYIHEGKTAQDTQEFNRARDYFLQKVSEPVTVQAPIASVGAPSVSGVRHVVRERSFYARPFAIVLTVIFICFALIAAYFLLERWVTGKPFTTGFQLAAVRMNIVIIPGIIYMIARIRAARKEERENKYPVA